jgi:deoxyribose-phosphate aldolase
MNRSLHPGRTSPASMPVEAMARRIEHGVLAPESGEGEVVSTCNLARAIGIRAVVVKPAHVSLARRLLIGTDVRAVCVVGFPHGGSLPGVKGAEAEAAVRDGADELDMVINIGALREGRTDLVRDELRRVVAAAAGRPVKVILETALLTDGLKIQACRLAQEAGAAYVKTSTGFSKGGATTADVALMRRTVGAHMGVKASGGIRSWADAAAMIDAGADLIGTSHTEAILAEARRAA